MYRNKKKMVEVVHRQLYGTQIIHLRMAYLPASLWRAGCRHYLLIPQGKPAASPP